jgi:hypothetical protein
MVRKALLFSIAALAAIALSTTPLMADQLALGGDGNVTFTGTGSTSGDVITVTTTETPMGCAAGSTCIGAVSGSFEAPTGTPIFTGAAWSFSLPTVSPLLSLLAAGFDTYKVDQNGGQMATFNFSGGGGDTLTGTIDWTTLAQSPTTSVATMSGTIMINSVVGGGTDGATFAADFAAGDTLGIDYSFSMPSLLSGVVGTTNTLTGFASSGEVPGAPEPTTLVIYGAGMLVIGSYFRKRRHV